MEEKVEKKEIKNKLSNYFNKLSIKTKVIFLIAIIIVVSLLLFIINLNKENSLSITTTSSLQKIIEINELSTVDYTYNAVATKYKEDKKEEGNEEYYVAYEGVVTAGIDFNEIAIDIDKKEKKINITLPQVEIHDVRVNMGTMEYIYIKKTKEEESISQEAYKLCKQDLKDRLGNEENLYNNARENAMSAVEALFKPWIETVDDDYKVEIK